MFLGVNIQQNQGWTALARWGFVSEQMIYRGAWWGLITTAFVHIEILHIAFNLYWLWILGGAFERRFGPAAILSFVFLSALVSSGLQLVTEGMGIGLSGVGYALFGFAWVTRRRYPEMARVMNDGTVRLFVIWFFICVFATYAHLMKIGNVAHLTGALVGCLVGWILTNEKVRVLSGAGLALLTAGAIAPLFWNPLSPDWLALQAERAENQRHYAKAVSLYLECLNRGGDPEFVWYNLAEIYGSQGRKQEYREAMKRLRAVSPQSADEVVEEYGDPAPVAR